MKSGWILLGKVGNFWTTSIRVNKKRKSAYRELGNWGINNGTTRDNRVEGIEQDISGMTPFEM